MPAMIAFYDKAMIEALKSPDVAARLEGLGFPVATSTPEELSRQVVAEREQWKPLRVEAGVIK